MGRDLLLRGLHAFPWGKAIILWMLVIFYFSHLPGSSYPVEVTTWYLLERKGAHVFEYFVLTTLFFGFLRTRFPKEKREILSILAVFAAVLYGVTDELHQYFTPYRGARITDVGIDMLGAILAIGWIGMMRRIFRSKYDQKK